MTTEEPPLEGLRKTSASDVSYGIRVVIGGSSYDWWVAPWAPAAALQPLSLAPTATLPACHPCRLGAGAGGIAYVGSFSWDTDVGTWSSSGFADRALQRQPHALGACTQASSCMHAAPPIHISPAATTACHMH